MRALSIALLSVTLAVPAVTTGWDAAGKNWWAHVQFLADDKLEGRNVGSPGFEKAAQYVADQFRAAGLQPAGTAGFFQRVDLTETSLDATSSSLSIVDARRTSALPISCRSAARL